VFSFPPENLVTLVAPWFFGTLSAEPGAPAYWGRCYPWEMSVFVGTAGIVLGMIGVAERAAAGRLVAWPPLLAIAVSGLALGANGPLLRPLYDWVPGFASFRGLSKFTFLLMLFMTLAIGVGVDALLRRRLPSRRLVYIFALVGMGLVAAGLWLTISPDRVGAWMAAIRASGESGLPDEMFGDRGFIEAAGLQAGTSLLIAGLLWVVVAGSLLATSRVAWLRLLPLGLLPLELLMFAAVSIETSSLSDAVPSECRKVALLGAGDIRMLNTVFPNNGFLLGVPDAGGNDPAVLKRYAEFVTASEGGRAVDATQHLPFSRLSPALAMLRVRFACVRQGDRIQVFENATRPLPTVLLVSDYRVLPTAGAVLSEVVRESFDPRRVVLLEEPPVPAPSATLAPGVARVLARTSDTLEIEVDTPTPAILLVTDLYSRGWSAEAVVPENNPQRVYDVLPANYVLRAIPLTAGRHHLMLEYRPSLIVLGAVVSLLAVAGWVAAWKWPTVADAPRS
jgi:hypothetical protein